MTEICLTRIDCDSFLFIQRFRRQSSICRQAHASVEVLHDIKLCWSYPPQMINPVLIDEYLRYIIRPVVNRFSSHMHQSLPLRHCHVPPPVQVCVDEKAIVAPDRLTSANCSKWKNPSSLSGWEIPEFFNLTCWADLSSARRVFTTML